MDQEKEEVLNTYKAIQQAMIDKDIDTLDSLFQDDLIFTHMSGKKQTKKEFFGEIRDGVLNYYSYQINDYEIEANDNTAVLKGHTTLTAKVYGMSGSWTLPVSFRFEKINGRWIVGN